MAYAKRRFVSVFYDIASEYPAVYKNDTALATWLRLLMTADAIWPAPASIPRSANEDAIALLSQAGLLTIDGDEYVVKGLDKLRRAMSDKGRAGAEARWGGNANEDAIADASAMPSTAQHTTVTAQHVDSPSLEGSHLLNDEGSRSDERTTIQKQTDERFGDDHVRPEFEALARKAEELTGTANALRNPFGGYATTLLSLVDIHGLETTLANMAMVRVQLGRRMTIKELVFGTESLMTRPVSAAQAVKAEREQEVDDGLKRRLERTQLSLHFQHTDPADHPACPACRGEVA